MRRAPNAWDRFYHDHAAPWRGERTLEDLLPWLGAGRLLELGAGNGKALRPLRRAGHDVVPLDISWNALRRLGDGVLADAQWLPFASKTFSGVLDLHCSGHLLAGGRKAAWAEMARVLMPGGHVVSERLARDDLRASKGDEPEPHTRQLKDGRSTHFVDEASLRQEAEAAGLIVVDVRTERRTPRFREKLVTRSSVRLVARRAGGRSPS